MQRWWRSVETGLTPDRAHQPDRRRVGAGARQQGSRRRLSGPGGRRQSRPQRGGGRTQPMAASTAIYDADCGHRRRRRPRSRPGFARPLRRSTPRLGAPSSSDSANTRELRAQLFSVLGYYGKDPAVLAQARQIAEKYLADPASVDPTLGQTALAIAARKRRRRTL